MAAPSAEVSCDDFLEFQESLKRMRTIDDKIVYTLNTSIPTESFRAQKDAANECKGLYEQLTVSYDQRDRIIRRCIQKVSENVRQLKDKRVEDRDNLDLLKVMRKEQTKLRLMQAEVNVEEVVKDRTLKVFYERCRSVYKPPDMKI